MKVDEVRALYLNYFKAPPRNHKEISAFPLVIENDPTTLFTSSGMQPLVPYLMGEAHPLGRRLVNSQPSLRTQDIEEVGDNRHTTFFEMLGNWSLGDYFKEEQLSWFWEFLTKKLNLPKEKLWVSVFEGDGKIPKDETSYFLWRKLGVPSRRIFYYKDNWWSRFGKPDDMPIGEMGGPDSEVFFEFDEVKHDLKYGKECHPACSCGRFLEIGNNVFMQYLKKDDGVFSELPQKNIDFGGGLERLTAAFNNNPDIFKIDVFEKIINAIEKYSGKSYGDNSREMRIMADHLRACVFLADSGITPSNKLQGYVMRRLLRRAALMGMNLNQDLFNTKLFSDIVLTVYQTYGGVFLDETKKENAVEIIYVEIEKFSKTLSRGLKIVEKLERVDAKTVFDLYQSFGFPFELIQEIFEKKGLNLERSAFDRMLAEHKEKSKTLSAGVFKGGLADSKVESLKLHTATHLLHESLRRVLGKEVVQKGSNINSSRLRFDFTYPTSLSREQIKKIEAMVNKQIDKNLVVTCKLMPIEKAQKQGALAFFKHKYGELVKVYFIEDEKSGEVFSKEVCGGPHVKRLSEIDGRVKIIKEKSVSHGVRRIYAIIE